MNYGHLDIGVGGLGEALIIAGEAPAAPDPADRPLDHPTSRQDLKAGRVVAALDNLQAPAPRLGKERVQARAFVGAIGPDQVEPGKELAQAGKHEQSPVAVLDVRRMDDGVQDETLRVDDDVALTTLDLLARVITHRVDRDPPFSADLTDWLSMMPALGLGSRPISSRSLTRRA